jgi:hypothetical protein
MKLLLTADHPFFEAARPAVFLQPWNNRWAVRWRDFYGVKQDEEFATVAEAMLFASSVNQPPMWVNDEDCGFDLAEIGAFWRDVATKVK